MPRTALLFPGQGAQYVGMAVELVQRSRVAEALFDQARGVLGYDLLRLCREGPAERLNATDVSQPAIFVSSLAAYAHWRQEGGEAAETIVAAAGLSLGEYTALTAAGAWSFAEGLRLVQARGQAMQAAAEAAPSGMVSVLGLEVAEVEELVAEARGGNQVLQIANYLCPGNLVVSGSQAAVERLEQLATARGIRTVRLAVAGAFHTPLMQPAEARLAAALAPLPIQPPRFPVWSNVDAQPHTDPAQIRSLLIRQVTAPVRWEETLRGLLASGVERFYEIGPGRVLAGLLKRVNRKAEVINIPA
ncbi:MAG: ACP S-malonyltransferase [Thermogemmata sp.]|nr:ACP S-malonyltransferase [Thermogemmata sp.]